MRTRFGVVRADLCLLEILTFDASGTRRGVEWLFSGFRVKQGAKDATSPRFRGEKGCFPVMLLGLMGQSCKR
jgi:hypothetical protein